MKEKVRKGNVGNFMGTLTVGYFDQFSSFRRLNSTQTRWCLPMLKLLNCYYSCNYISWTFLHHYVNVVSYLTNSSFKHGHFWSRVVSNETSQLSIELIALIKQNKLPCSHFDISVSGGAKKMVQTADKHTEISNVSKMNQSSFRWLSNSYI